MAVAIETTRVYGGAIEVVRLVNQFSAGLRGYLADQAKRASASIVLNLAEGCGRTGARDRLRFFTTARASAREVIAIADVAEALGLADATSLERLRDTCDHVGAMLYKFR